LMRVPVVWYSMPFRMTLPKLVIMPIAILAGPGLVVPEPVGVELPVLGGAAFPTGMTPPPELIPPPQATINIAIAKAKQARTCPRRNQLFRQHTSVALMS
jgi:hypothetical protein